jgi:hypothetical protein
LINQGLNGHHISITTTRRSITPASLQKIRMRLISVASSSFESDLNPAGKIPGYSGKAASIYQMAKGETS